MNLKVDFWHTICRIVNGPLQSKLHNESISAGHHQTKRPAPLWLINSTICKQPAGHHPPSRPLPVELISMVVLCLKFLFWEHSWETNQLGTCCAGYKQTAAVRKQKHYAIMKFKAGKEKKRRWGAISVNKMSHHTVPEEAQRVSERVEQYFLFRDICILCFPLK